MSEGTNQAPYRTKGIVSFAQMGVPNSRCVRTLVNDANNRGLDSDFPPVGRVVETMAVLESL